MTEIASQTFQGLVNVKELDLSQKKISELKKNAFDTLENLQYIQISNNDLISIEEGAFKEMVNSTRINSTENIWNVTNQDLLVICLSPNDDLTSLSWKMFKDPDHFYNNQSFKIVLNECLIWFDDERKWPLTCQWQMCWIAEMGW